MKTTKNISEIKFFIYFYILDINNLTDNAIQMTNISPLNTERFFFYKGSKNVSINKFLFIDTLRVAKLLNP